MLRRTPMKRPTRAEAAERKAEKKAKRKESQAKLKPDTLARQKHQAKWEKVCEDLARKVCLSVGSCEAAGWEWNGKVYSCSDRLEWAHVKSRRHISIKYDPENATCLCNTHHKFFTQHPDQWFKFIETKYPGRWDSLNEKLNGRKLFMDFELIATGLYEILALKGL